MMAPLPYGLSVHHFISQVGSYVGFAAIVAVAIMVLLLFAHARETSELRRRAEDAEDELSVLHEQVEWLRDTQRADGASQSAGTGGLAGAPASVPPPASVRGGRGVAGPAALTSGAGVASAATSAGAGGSAGAVAPVPAPAAASRRTVVFGAPVGVGAPALSSATKLIPPTDEELRAVAAAAGALAEMGPPAPSESAPVPGGPRSGGRRSSAAVAPPPSTVAAAGNGASRRPPEPPSRGGGFPGERGAVTSPRRNYGSGSGSARGGSGGSGGSGRSRRTSRTLIAVVTLLVAAIVVVVVLVVGGGSSHKSHSSTAAASRTSAVKRNAKGSTKDKTKSATVDINPSTVTVSVLNGTTTANLAADVSSKLSAKGFKPGLTGNASSQSLTTTIVGYVPSASGAKDDAYAVAKSLGLKQSAVQPVSSANQTVACSGNPTSCPDQVIVALGSDLNSDAA
jgi:preprotein translocase subunit SecG